MNPEMVMLVDDNDTDNFIHKRIIELTNFAVSIEVKNSADAALAYLQELGDNPDALPDLIFLDMNMPLLDGKRFLDELGKMPEDARQKLAVVILSSLPVDQDHVLTKNPMVKKVLSKPLTEDILRRLKRELAKGKKK